jgi:hypothetical protein
MQTQRREERLGRNERRRVRILAGQPVAAEHRHVRQYVEINGCPGTVSPDRTHEDAFRPLAIMAAVMSVAVGVRRGALMPVIAGFRTTMRMVPAAPQHRVQGKRHDGQTGEQPVHCPQTVYRSLSDRLAVAGTATWLRPGPTTIDITIFRSPVRVNAAVGCRPAGSPQLPRRPNVGPESHPDTPG